MENAISEYRNVTVTFTGGAAPIDSYKAAMEVVKTAEGKYFKNPALVTDLVAAPVLCTGALPFQIHVFEVTLTKATGIYIFDYVETKPNADA